MNLRCVVVWSVLSVCGAAYIAPFEVLASPAFARKYDVKCTKCHTSFPRLSEYGLRFRANGYRLPENEERERLVTESRTPLAFRTGIGFDYERFTQNPASVNTSQFQLTGVDLMSSGLIATDIGYWLLYCPKLDGSALFVPQQDEIESANVIFRHAFLSPVNVRVGKFEPAYVAFSTHRSLTLAPYDVYGVKFPGGASFEDNQVGVELTESGSHRFEYAAGAVVGPSAANLGDGKPDFYFRVEKLLSKVKIQTTGQRLGASAYFGSSNAAGQSDLAGRKTFNRLGVDASFNIAPWVLNLQYLTGHDAAALWNTHSDITTSGGFAELLCQPRRDIVAFARYDCVQMPAALNTSITRWTVGVRRYLRQNLAVHLEFSAQSMGAGFGATRSALDNAVTLRFDYAL